MNKEQIQTRLELLEKEREQLRATVLAYDGAIQESKHWLSEIDKPEEVKTDD